MAAIEQLKELEELGLEQPNMLHIQESYLRQIVHAKPFTSKKQTKGEVSMTTAKWFRQKGTGRARQGAQSNPHMHGGGRAFPPRPRVRQVGLNKHVRQSALRSAMLWHIQQGTAFVITGDDFDSLTKTREAVRVLNEVTRYGRIALVVRRDAIVRRACRNIWNVLQLLPDGINVRDLMDAHFVVFSASALADYRELLKLRLVLIEPEEAAESAAEVEA